jgi:hypothetical protein
VVHREIQFLKISDTDKLRAMKIRLSSIAIGMVLLTCLVIDFDLKNWRKQDRVIEWDVHSYYAYLPALFIYNDIKLEKSIYQFDTDYWLFWPNVEADGRRIIKTSMGTAIMYAPFFFIAHAFAESPLSVYSANGFSEPYKLFLLLSAVFYLFVGLVFVQKNLSHFSFSEAQTALTILLIGTGTNLLCYSSQSAPMPHVYSFCLVAVFIFYAIKWHEQRTIKNTLIIGLLLGLISLIRITNILIVLFFILYDAATLSALKEKIFFFFKKYYHLLIAVAACLLVWLPQIIYWKTVSSKYFYYSYPDEHFFFLHPQIMEGLFGFRKGWLVYTPMMAFAIAGIFLMRNDLKKFALNITIFLLLNIYIIFSWWAWWYGGTFGQRPMVESYALLAIPFASFVKFITERKLFVQIGFYCIAGFFIWLNIFQTYQFEVHSLHWDGMTTKLYFKQFAKMDRIPDYDKYVERPDYGKAKLGFTGIEINQVIDTENREAEKKELSRKQIQLTASNEKYVCADEAGERRVIVNRSTAGLWETFTLIMFDNNECNIQTHDGHFFSADLGSTTEISAIRTAAYSWELFTLVELGNNIVAFKAGNNKYWSLEKKSMKLFASVDSIGENEKFTISYQ